MGLDPPQDGITNPKFKLLHLITTIFCKEKKAQAFNWDRCCHLVLWLQLILFHCSESYLPFSYALLLSYVLRQKNVGPSQNKL
jgi:hypothetical protein